MSAEDGSDTTANEIASAMAALERDRHDRDARLRLAALVARTDPERASDILAEAPAKVRDTYPFAAGVVRLWLDAGDPARALAAHGAVRALGPDRGETHRLAGALAEGEGRHAEAAHHYGCALKVLPDRAPIRLRLALAQIRSGHPRDGARTMMADAKALESFPWAMAEALSAIAEAEGPDAVLALLDEVASVADLPDLEARARLAAARALPPDADPESVLAIVEPRADLARRDAGLAERLVAATLSARGPERAEALIDGLREAHPGAPFLFMRLGQIRQLRGQRAAALAIFREGARRNPDHDGLRLAALREALAVAPSEDVLARAVSSDDVREVKAALAHLIGAGRLIEAAAAVRRHEERAGPVLALERGRIARTRRDWVTARNAFGEVLQADPDNPDAIAARAISEMHLGRPRAIGEAVARLDDLPQTSRVLDNLQRLQELAGLTDAALATAEALLAREPERVAYRLRVAGALAAAGRPGDARDALASVLAELEESASARMECARLLWTLGDLDEAVDCAAPFADPSAWPVPALVALAEYCVAIGRLEAASSLLQQVPTRSAEEIADRARGLALLHRERLAFADAVAACEEGLEARPDDQRLRTVKTRCLVALGRARDAHAALVEAGIGEAGVIDEVSNLPVESLFSFDGQIVNEMLLHEDLHDALAAAMASDPEAGLPRVAALVREDGQCTVPAVALFALMRLTGRLDPPAPGGTRSDAIPKRIHQYWEGDDVPADVCAFARRLADLHPDHEHTLWQRRTAARFLKENFGPGASAAFFGARHAAARADLLRLALMDRVGGIFVDVDDWCRQPLDPLLPEGAALVLHQEEHASIGNNFIAAAPGHPVIAACLRNAEAEVTAGSGDMAWLMTGPGLMTRVLAASAAGTAGPPRLDEGIVVWRRQDLMRCLAAGRPMMYKRRAHWQLVEFGLADGPDRKRRVAA